MNKPKISILVPIYNVEKYLQRCIDSVLSQDFTDWELILVDDGSPDKCPQICDEQAYKVIILSGDKVIAEQINRNNDKRIITIHKSNGGLISARRCGVSYAAGEYYVFLDSDDTLCPNALSLLLGKITEGYDVVRGLPNRVNERTGEEKIEHYSIESGEENGEYKYLVDLYLGRCAPYLWGGMYKSTLFDTTKFDTAIANKITVAEDWVTNLIVAKDVRKVAFVTEKVSNYYYNPNSMMNTFIISNEYDDKLNRVLDIEGVNEITCIKEKKATRDIVQIIANYFKPELTFDFTRYKRISSYLKSGGSKNEITEYLPYKYVHFIDCLPLFYIYSRFYNLMYKFFKLKGKKRRIIS